MTYPEWAATHGTIFSLTSEADVAMLRSWCEVFRAAAITPEELSRATQWLAVNDPPRFRTDHLRALQTRIREQRLAETTRRTPDDDRGTCVDCGGTGRVIVPHPQPPNRAYWYTAAVLCHCPLGRWFGEQQRGQDKIQMHYDDYTKLRPHWRNEWREHEDYLKLEANAEAYARRNDRLFGEVLQKLTQTTSQPTP